MLACQLFIQLLASFGRSKDNSLRDNLFPSIKILNLLYGWLSEDELLYTTSRAAGDESHKPCSKTLLVWAVLF